MISNLQFSTAIVKKVINETPQAKHFQLELKNPRVAATYKIPGQYALFRVPGFKDGFFAMASHPDEKEWGFLIKEASPLTAHLLGMKQGNEFEVGSAQGKGFAMDALRGKEIYLFAAGSGISALRPVLLEIFKNRKNYGSVTLFYGARNPDEFAYAREFPEWEKKGVKISRIISNTEHKEWKGPMGHVEQLIPTKFDPKKTVALLCGMPEMVDETTQTLKDYGLDPKLILTNY